MSITLSPSQLRTLKKYLRVLGHEYKGVQLDERTRGMKYAFRQVLGLLDRPVESLNHVVEKNLDDLIAKYDREGEKL